MGLLRFITNDRSALHLPVCEELQSAIDFVGARDGTGQRQLEPSCSLAGSLAEGTKLAINRLCTVRRRRMEAMCSVRHRPSAFRRSLRTRRCRRQRERLVALQRGGSRELYVHMGAAWHYNTGPNMGHTKVSLMFKKVSLITFWDTFESASFTHAPKSF
jgi:hypothetical protein